MGLEQKRRGRTAAYRRVRRNRRLLRSRRSHAHKTPEILRCQARSRRTRYCIQQTQQVGGVLWGSLRTRQSESELMTSRARDVEYAPRCTSSTSRDSGPATERAWSGSKRVLYAVPTVPSKSPHRYLMSPVLSPEQRPPQRGVCESKRLVGDPIAQRAPTRHPGNAFGEPVRCARPRKVAAAMTRAGYGQSTRGKDIPLCA